jgi:hypothetical protein
MMVSRVLEVRIRRTEEIPWELLKLTAIAFAPLPHSVRNEPLKCLTPTLGGSQFYCQLKRVSNKWNSALQEESATQVCHLLEFYLRLES